MCVQVSVAIKHMNEANVGCRNAGGGMGNVVPQPLPLTLPSTAASDRQLPILAMSTNDNNGPNVPTAMPTGQKSAQRKLNTRSYFRFKMLNSTLAMKILIKSYIPLSDHFIW